MKPTRLIKFTILASLIFATRLLQAAEPEAREARSGVPVPFSESVPLHCTSNDRDYDLFIRYPDGYREEKNKDRRYPIIYICDAQWDFFLISGIYPTQIFDQKIEESILVGMAWGGKTSNYWQYRGIDYTTVPMSGRNPDGGGAAKFLTALKTEIIPFVEQRVHADSTKRVLTGSSYGGMFVLYTLLTEPDLFYGYIAPTPAVAYGDGQLLKLESSTAGKRKAPKGRLFMTAGSLEDEYWRQPIFDFEKALISRKYPDFAVKTVLIPGEGHSGQKAEAYNRGLRFVFEK